MATVSKGRTFVSGETVTPAKLNELVDNATVTAIQTADISDSAVTNAKIASGVDASKLTTGTLPADRIASSSVTAAKLSDTLDLSGKTVTLPATATRNSSQIYSRDNIVGTTTQSSGIPTGAILESGSNAAGRYIRFANGTQLCFAKRSAPANWTFPISFSAAPIVTATPDLQTAAMSCVANASTTSVEFRIFGSGGSESSGNVNLMAAGVWF